MKSLKLIKVLRSGEIGKTYLVIDTNKNKKFACKFIKYNSFNKIKIKNNVKLLDFQINKAISFQFNKIL